MRSEIPPLVSIYIISHNYGRFLSQSVDSVLTQSFSDFEIIIIDDGSTDDTPQVLAKYAGNEKVHLILQQNKGLSVTNNIALRTARGKYIMRLDADDYLHPDALKLLSVELESDPDVGMVFPDYYEIDENGNTIAEIRRHDFDDVTLLDQPAHGACTMIRRRCLEEIGGYDETIGCQDGYELWIRFIEHYKVKNINAPLFYYRQHGNNLTGDETRLLDTRAGILDRHAQRKGKHLSCLAIVPVRGKPADPNSPALSIFGGKPLIDWTLEAALEAERISGVIVTTPDDDILAHVETRWPDQVMTVRRDSQLAQANTMLVATLRHAVEIYESDHPSVDALMTLAIECPFRTARQLNSAVHVMELFDTDATVGVRPETDHFYRHNGGGLEPMREDIHLRLERDELYREVARMRLIKRHLLFDNDGLPGGRVGHVVVDQMSAMELRSEFDWTTAEMLAAGLGRT